MSRKRYISTDISTDIRLAELAEHGSLPLLLYTWSIPHMDDWGRITGDPRQFKLTVCPALDISTNEVNEMLDLIFKHQLWIRYEIDGKKCICIPDERWFKHQSYINKSKRNDDAGSNFPSPPQNAEEYRETPKNAEEQQQVPQNAVSFSSSSSVSFSASSSPSVLKDMGKQTGPDGPTRTKFTPPTIDEVIDYCSERNNVVDPQKWHDFYTAKNWFIGKTKMKDWKAAVRTWERSNTAQTLHQGQKKLTTMDILKEKLKQSKDREEQQYDADGDHSVNYGMFG